MLCYAGVFLGLRQGELIACSLAGVCVYNKEIPFRHSNIDIAIIRENTEGEYSGLEHEVCIYI